VIERSDNVLAIQMAAQAMSNFPTSDKYKISIDLQVGEGADSVMLLTNEQAVTRILVLLLDNAERFTKEGSITLLVDQKDGKVQFIVEDTGIGIPVSEAEHIFEEFVQLNEYETGTGIGLTVARSICHRLGGNIVLDTSYTNGARFVMTLPL
jgi:signal transduction histidine kinase